MLPRMVPPQTQVSPLINPHRRSPSLRGPYLSIPVIIIPQIQMTTTPRVVLRNRGMLDLLTAEQGRGGSSCHPGVRMLFLCKITSTSSCCFLIAKEIHENIKNKNEKHSLTKCFLGGGKNLNF